MDHPSYQIFTIGEELGEQIHIFVHRETFDGTVEDVGGCLEDGSGYQSLEGGFLVKPDEMMIDYRIPSLSGEQNTFLLGEDSFHLKDGKSFLLESVAEATQLPHDTVDAALEQLLAEDDGG